MSEQNLTISKTAFLKFEQCAKAFYLYKKHYYLRDQPTREKQLIFERGHTVGRLAQQLFPGGIDVSAEAQNAIDAVQLTAKYIENRTPVIYEAAFQYNQILVMVDILVFDGEKYLGYEVKSSLKINDTYIKDACLQYFVVKKCIPQLEDFFLVNLNGDYVLEGAVDVKKLFRRRSVRIDAEKNVPFFDHRSLQMLETLERGAIPGVPIGKHCFSPYQCEFLSTCWKNTDHPKSIFNIGKVGKEQLFDWYWNGIQTVDKLSPDSSFQEWINIQIKSLNTDKEHINKEKIMDFLKRVKTPFAFLDMEIWSPAVPVYEGTKPFEQIPFLYSLCYSESEVLHFKNYFKPIQSDSREEFLLNLLQDSSSFETIIVYDKNLEVQVLNALRTHFPSYEKQIKELIAKMTDIADIVLNFWYYHPSFKGSFSLKAVAEIIEDYTLQPEISSGIVAMYAYESLLNQSNPILAENTKQQLIDYCNSDTEISLRFFNFLKEKVNAITD